MLIELAENKSISENMASQFEIKTRKVWSIQNLKAVIIWLKWKKELKVLMLQTDQRLIFLLYILAIKIVLKIFPLTIYTIMKQFRQEVNVYSEPISSYQSKKVLCLWRNYARLSDFSNETKIPHPHVVISSK